MLQFLEKSKLRRNFVRRRQRPSKRRTIGATQEATITIERGRITIAKIMTTFLEILRQRSVSPSSNPTIILGFPVNQL
jgi:hypothetical protein